MNTAFEITTDDIENILTHRVYPEGYRLAHPYMIKPTTEAAQMIFEEIKEEDFTRIEKAATWGTDMDTQIDYAYQKLFDILKEKKIFLDRSNDKPKKDMTPEEWDVYGDSQVK